jgi:hypothetical protein
MKVIAKKLGFQYPFPEDVKFADKSALEYEWKNKVLKDLHISLTSKEAKESFLNLYYKLK